MITQKELQFVELWASKIPIPGIEYSREVMNEIKKSYETYNELYKDKEYNFIFSNGEEINFEILTKNLCHMLGIDYQNIKNECFSDYRLNVLKTNSSNLSSYELLELLIENSEKVIEHDNNINNKLKAINYYKSGIKCQIFKKLSDFEKFNFAVINCTKNNANSDYTKEKYFFIPSNESVCPYFMMGIRLEEPVTTFNGEDPDKKDLNKNAKYFVTTLRAPSDPKEMFENQEVIIPTQLLVSDKDILRRANATPEEKINLLTMYKNIIHEYQIPNKLNIYGDYENMLNEQQKVLK